MKGKGSLALMEQIVMLLVFALAAALCLQAFVKSDQLSRRSQDADHAMALCQSVAETICNNGGDIDAAFRTLNGREPGHRDGFGAFEGYNSDWEPISGDGRESSAYTLQVLETPSEIAGLATAKVEAYVWESGEMHSLFSIDIAWQEVSGHG